MEQVSFIYSTPGTYNSMDCMELGYEVLDPKRRDAAKQVCMQGVGEEPFAQQMEKAKGYYLSHPPSWAPSPSTHWWTLTGAQMTVSNVCHQQNHNYELAA